ncbi:MAG: tRNA (adenosine(37)-N6)-dimethylallyltransferase MiaA [Candidatus Komeilibacteria bacterium]
MSRKNNKLIIILGPTASGKTNLAIKLARQYKGEIISADSRQIYQEMAIGTAQPNKIELAAVPHHLIASYLPNHEFSLAKFIIVANQLIKKIQQANKLPFLVGGTGLYISAIVNNYKLPTGRHDKILQNRLGRQSADNLYRQLRQLDPDTAATIDKNNIRRLSRALAYVLANQKSWTKQQQHRPSPYDILQIGLRLDLPTLEKNIAQRTKAMLTQGLVQETRTLLKKYSPDLPALQTIGYQEIISYLKGNIDKKTAEKNINLHTRQYAKRQITWFKRDPRIQWVYNSNEANKIVAKWLQNKPDTKL